MKMVLVKKMSQVGFTVLVLLACAGPAQAVRIKELVSIKGVRTNQLIGYGLVVGLNGTGDNQKARFTIQSLANMMAHMGVQVSPDQLKVKNVAAVMVTAEMPPFARIGTSIDIMVSSVGDAKSLAGGTLLLTPLNGVDGNTYALAQGALALGGAGAAGAAGAVVKNHLQVARVAGGATVEREIPMQLDGRQDLTFSLFNPDFTTALRISETINNAVGKRVAKPVDSATMRIQIPEEMRADVTLFIAGLETLEVMPDSVAKIVVNEKTGTVVIGENVRISTVAISHGNLSITIQESEMVSQPGPFAGGETVTTRGTDITMQEDKSKVMLVPGAATIGDLVRALNAIGVTPRDMISIFQSIKAAGAMQADLVII